MDFLPDEKVKCHLTAFEKSCKDMVLNHSCRKWVKLQCKHPQTGADVDKWDCADTWAPLLDVAIIQAIENSVGGLHAATNSFRNEVARQTETILTGSPRIAAVQRILPSNGGSARLIEQQND